MKLYSKALGIAYVAVLLLSLSACSSAGSTHDARIPADCNITSLKKILPSLGLLLKENPGDGKSLQCSTIPMTTKHLDQKHLQSKMAEATIIQYESGGVASLSQSDLKKEMKDFSRVELSDANGCKVLREQNPGKGLILNALCNGFTIYVMMPSKTSWADGLKVASAAIVGLIQ